MVSLSTTIAQLAGWRAPHFPTSTPEGPGHLTALADFGSNPGRLDAFCHVPKNLSPGAPLVVILHGCTQTAEEYDRGAGWSRLADTHGFALLYPQQRRANNPNLCFNWFSPPDARRDSGEPHSIRQMIAALALQYRIDENRIFITGLSAGGAMTSTMLACYPEVFAGGAIIAGLPYGCATSVPDAFARMAGEGFPPDDRLAALVRKATSHSGRWPRISAWQGNADQTVHPVNAAKILAQWQPLHGVADTQPEQQHVPGGLHRVWRNDSGDAVIEAYDIDGMGHGTPIHTVGPDGCGSPGPYMLETGISSTRRIAASWGLAPAMAEERSAGHTGQRVGTGKSPPRHAHHKGQGVGDFIENALRAAGLMR